MLSKKIILSLVLVFGLIKPALSANIDQNNNNDSKNSKPGIYLESSSSSLDFLLADLNPCTWSTSTKLILLMASLYSVSAAQSSDPVSDLMSMCNYISIQCHQATAANDPVTQNLIPNIILNSESLRFENNVQQDAKPLACLYLDKCGQLIAEIWHLVNATNYSRD